MNNSLLSHIPYRHTSGTKYVHCLFLISLLILFVSTLRAQTPNWAWGVQLHGNQNDFAKHLDTDHSGNTLVAGVLSSLGLEIQDTVLVNEPYVWEYDAYLSVLNSEGNLRWAKRFHAEREETVATITLNSAIFDSEGDIYLLGQTFGSIAINDTLINSDESYYYNFLIEFSPEGDVKWFMTYDESYIATYEIVSDEHGGIYLSGELSDYLEEYDFGGTIVDISDSNNPVAFIAHYNSANSADWVNLINGQIRDYKIKSNGVGDVFFTGSFSANEIVIDTFHLFANEEIKDEFFAGKCNIQGQVEWASVLSPQEEEICAASAVNDDLYLLGSFKDYAYIVISNDTIYAPDSPTSFLIHINGIGESIASTVLNTTLECDDITIAASPHGELFMGISLIDSIWTGSEMLYQHEPYSDPAVIRYNELLEPQSGFSLQMIDNAYTPSLEWDAFGNLIFLTRLYGDTLVFGADTLINVQLSYQSDPILARSLDCSTTPVSLKFVGGLLYAPVGLTYQWYYNGDQIDNATASYYLPLQSGEYAVRIELENGCFAWGRASELTFSSPEDLEIIVFPNPAQNQVNVVVPAYADQCVIYDVLGRKLFEWENLESLNATLNISTPGVYFAQVRYNDNSKTIEFVVL